MRRALWFTPIRDHGPRSETMTAILAQDYDASEFAVDMVLTRNNPHAYAEIYRNVQDAYNHMADIARHGKYDVIWIVEEDIVPPPETFASLVDMLDAGADLASAIYELRHGARKPNLFRYDNPQELGQGLEWKDLDGLSGNVLRVSGACMGCIAMKPVALEFDFVLAEPRAPDMAWMKRNLRRGLITLARLDLRCAHIDIDGTVLTGGSA